MNLQTIGITLVVLALYIIIRKYYKNSFLRSPEIKQLLAELNIKPKHFLKAENFRILLDSERKKLVVIGGENEEIRQVYDLQKAEKCTIKERFAEEVTIASSLIIEFIDMEQASILFFEKERDSPYNKRWLLIQIDNWKKLIDSVIAGHH
nr:hypothetical protein [Pseudopedobacter sp.]